MWERFCASPHRPPQPCHCPGTSLMPGATRRAGMPAQQGRLGSARRWWALKGMAAHAGWVHGSATGCQLTEGRAGRVDPFLGQEHACSGGTGAGMDGSGAGGGDDSPRARSEQGRKSAVRLLLCRAPRKCGVGPNAFRGLLPAPRVPPGFTQAGHGVRPVPLARTRAQGPLALAVPILHGVCRGAALLAAVVGVHPSGAVGQQGAQLRGGVGHE